MGFCEFTLLTDFMRLATYFNLIELSQNGCLENAHARFCMSPNGMEIIYG